MYSHQPEVFKGEKPQNSSKGEKEKEKKKKNSFKTQMNENFYKPLFQKTYEHLQPGGIYALNINQEIYEAVCVPLWGEAQEKIPLKKSQRQNNYSEYIYVFHFHF
jgi:anthranilate/para-aminobenzoate synthase component I